MKDIVLNLGGKLTPGDVVGVAYNNHTVFGWFVEGGKYGSLKFINMKSLHYIDDQYQKFLNGDKINTWYSNRFKKGFDFKTINKDYIIAFSGVDNRAFKIQNPEEFFSGAGDTEKFYLEGKKLLNDIIKFPAK